MLGGIQQQTPTKKTGEYAKMDGIVPAKIREVNLGVKAKTSPSIYNEIVFEVTNGEFKGRRIWEKFYIENKNSKAVEISQKKLVHLLTAAVGKGQVGSFLEGEKELETLINTEMVLNVATNDRGFASVKRFNPLS